MSSDIETSDPSATDSLGSHADSTRSKTRETKPPVSSVDEIGWNVFLGQAPDPMLEPLKSSSDDLGRMIAQAQPDPMLTSQVGEFGKPATKNGSQSFDDAARHEAPRAEDPIAAFSSIRTDAPLIATSGRKARANKDRQDEDADVDEDGDVDAPASRSSYAMILLASYASAITLGLIWILATGRTFQNTKDPAIASAAARFKSRFDKGVRAEGTRIVCEPSAIPDSHRAALGETVKLNDLEVTPLELREGPVELEWTLAERKTRHGGQHALKLKIRFRNTSQSAIFAPLDEGFIRQRLRADSESFIESKTGQPIIAMFPLAVDSEWAITGQEFRELRPGESFESIIVSEPNARGRFASEMVWRIHLRTGINQLGDFGLTFRPADIKPGK